MALAHDLREQLNEHREEAKRQQEREERVRWQREQEKVAADASECFNSLVALMREGIPFGRDTASLFVNDTYKFPDNRVKFLDTVRDSLVSHGFRTHWVNCENSLTRGPGWRFQIELP